MKRSLLLFFVAILVSLPLTDAEPQPYQGFGATTPGGSGRPVVHVTNLNDSGPGSLREALSAGNRTIVFDVAGEIILTTAIRVRGAFITVDGFSAPTPGITLRGAGLSLHGSKGAHDIIVRGIRIRDSTATPSHDGITIAYGAYNIVVDHVSISGSADENIDITEGSHDVTVSWSILAGNGKNMLIKYNPSRVTLDHNILTESAGRNPQVRIDNAGTPATDTTLDMRNNIVWDWSGYGTRIWDGPRANILNNYYSFSNNAIQVLSARAYVDGNLGADNRDINQSGNETNPFPAPWVDTQDACTAAKLVLANAGVRPLDSVDQEYLSRITLGSPCAVPSSTMLVRPDSLSFGASFAGADPAPQELTITHEGSETLSWEVSVTTTIGGPWLSVSPTNGIAPSTLTVTANTLGLAGGLYEGSVTVQATATHSVQSIPVSLVIGPPLAGSGTFRTRVCCGEDDAREYGSGKIKKSEGNLSVGKGNLLAFRFPGVTIPPGAIIESAMLQMYGVGNLGKIIKIRYLGEATGDSAPFKQDPWDLSSRLKTQAFMDDIPGLWKKNDFNPSPDLSPIIQEIVNYPDWVSGNSLTLLIADNGSTQNRKIGAFESGTPRVKTALLTIMYQAP